MRSGYRLIKRIGAGSYGNVYLVVDPATGVEWALKVERPSNNVASVKAVVKPAKSGDDGGGGNGRTGGTRRRTGVAVEALLEARIILALQHPNVVHTRSVQFDDVNPSMIASVSELGQLTLREYLACDHRDDMETELGGFRASRRRTRASATASDRAHRPSSIPPRPPGKSRRRRRRRRRSSRSRHRDAERRGGDTADFSDGACDDEEREEEEEEPFVAVPLDRTVFWERLAMMRGLVAGMHYFHGMKVAHFDLKPDNILLFARLVYAAGAVLIATKRQDAPATASRSPSSSASSSAATTTATATKRETECEAPEEKKAEPTSDEADDAAAKARWPGPAWDAKHADFGLAELVTGLTPDQPIGGTSSHRAPEILRPLSNTRVWPFAKDYWSMLVVIWSAVFCCHPFVSGDEFSRISDELHVLALVFARLGRPSDVWIRMNVDADAQRELAAAERIARLRRERRDERRRAGAIREKVAEERKTAAATAAAAVANRVTRSRSVAPAARAEAAKKKKKEADAETKRGQRRPHRAADDDDDVEKEGKTTTKIGPNGRTPKLEARTDGVRKKTDVDAEAEAADDTSSSDDDDDDDDDGGENGDETLPTSTFGAADPRSSDGAADQMRVIVALLEMRTGVSYNTWCAAYGTPVMHALMRTFALGFVYAADARSLDFESVWRASGLPERPSPPTAPRHDAVGPDDNDDDDDDVGCGISSSSSSSNNSRLPRNKDDAPTMSSRSKSALAEKRGATATASSSDAKNATAPPATGATNLPPSPAPRYPTFAPLDDSKHASWFDSEKRRLPAPIAKTIWEVWTVLTLLGHAKTKPIVSYATSAADAQSRSPDRWAAEARPLRPKRGLGRRHDDDGAAADAAAVKGKPSASVASVAAIESAEKVPSPTTSEYCAILSLATKLAGFKDDLKFFGRMRDRPARTLESMYARQNEIIAALFTVRFSESWVVVAAAAKSRPQPPAATAAAAAAPASPSTTVARAATATSGMWPVDASVASRQVATMSEKLSASSRGSTAAATRADTRAAPKKSTKRIAIPNAAAATTTTTTTAAPKNAHRVEDRGATKVRTAASATATVTDEEKTTNVRAVGRKKAEEKGALSSVSSTAAAVVRETPTDASRRRDARESATGSEGRRRRSESSRFADSSRTAKEYGAAGNAEKEGAENDDDDDDERDREFGGTRLGYRSRTVEVTDTETEDDWRVRARLPRRKSVGTTRR